MKPYNYNKLLALIRNTWNHAAMCKQIIIIIITPLEFFTLASADGFSEDSEWQQVSSSLQGSSQDSGRLQ